MMRIPCPNCGHSLLKPRPGLTRQMKRALDAIERLTVEKGYAPSHSELCAALGLKSKSTITRLTKSLETRGYISRGTHHSRSVRVIRQDASP
jgi:SOS-response transcriptional repressor LexA